MTESYRCWAEVDLDALRQNLARIRTLAPDQKILTVVKADAYGHGLRQISAVLMQSGTDIFGVANLAEARAIRSVGRGWPVLMLGACLPEEMELAIGEGVILTISTAEEAQQVSTLARQLGTQAQVHVKVDTGMGRLGAKPSDALGLTKGILSLPAVSLSGLYTHYSSAEDDAAFTAQQRHTFAHVVQSISALGAELPYVHASNSAGVLLEAAGPCNTVRAGLLVYGVVPPGLRLPEHAFERQFTPALSWKCRVSLVKSVPAGTPVSYGHTLVTSEQRRLATITAGYGDGYFRAASNRGQVLIRGGRCAVLGRITMDQIIVDVTRLPEVRPGDEAVLLGRQENDQITAREMAQWCGTIPWEILTNITYRVPRLYRGCHAA